MPPEIDRRTFVIASSIAAAGALGLTTPLHAAAGVTPQTGESTPLAHDAAATSAELRIVGWDQDESPTSVHAERGDSIHSWVAIDQQWRGAWR